MLMCSRYSVPQIMFSGLVLLIRTKHKVYLMSLGRTCDNHLVKNQITEQVNKGDVLYMAIQYLLKHFTDNHQ